MNMRRNKEPPNLKKGITVLRMLNINYQMVKRGVVFTGKKPSRLAVLVSDNIISNTNRLKEILS